MSWYLTEGWVGVSGSVVDRSGSFVFIFRDLQRTSGLASCSYLQRKTSLVIQFLRDLAQPYPPAPRWLISLLSFPLSTGASEQILLFVFFFKQFLAV